MGEHENITHNQFVVLATDVIKKVCLDVSSHMLQMSQLCFQKCGKIGMERYWGEQSFLFSGI